MLRQVGWACFCIATMTTCRAKRSTAVADLAAASVSACQPGQAVNRSYGSVRIEKPLENQVIQRDASNYGDLLIAGVVSGATTCIEARVLNAAGQEIIGWTKMGDQNAIRWWRFSAKMRVQAGGWYALKTRAWEKNAPTQESTTHFGVGEVFIAAGQSNSGNYGSERQVPHDNRIVAFDGMKWGLASDPQPLATTDGAKNGSPWPPMADELIKTIDVPIGILSVGWGGTSVSEWQPGGKLYPRLKNALTTLGTGGARAVLWHQGEADGRARTSSERYQSLLKNLIASSQNDAGYRVIWFVAQAAYLTDTPEEFQDAIRQAQRDIVDQKFIFAGPLTDDMHGEYRSADHVHMSGPGLREHGRRWGQILAAYFNSKKSGE